MNTIILGTSYNGAVKVEVEIDGEWCILENEMVESLIRNAMTNGYHTEKTPRQKYKRVILEKI